MAKVDGQEYGPFTWDQMLQMAAEGRVTPDLPVRQASDSQWSTAAAIPGLLGHAKPAAPRPVAKVPAPPTTVAGNSAIKVARPSAPPPAGRPVPPVVAAPRNIPAGIPVGAPVRVAAGPPLAPPVAASSPGVFSLDLGSSPSGKSPAVKSVLDDDDELVTPKKSHLLLIVGVLGGVSALVAVIVGVTIYVTMFRGGDENIAATNTSADGDAAQEEASPGQAGPADQAGAVAQKAELSTAKTTKRTTSDAKAETAGQKAIILGIRDWKNIATLKSVGIGNARIAVSRVWLAADAAGNRAVLPGAESGKPAPTAETPTEEDTSAVVLPTATSTKGTDKARFVFIEITISNKAAAPLKYKGWNNVGIHAAILADDQNQILPLIPKSETPGVQRLAATNVPGGGSLVETLVFAAPADSFDSLHLALPQAVFYSSVKGKNFALEITPDVLDTEGGPPVVSPPPAGFAGGEGSDPLVSGRKVPTEPGTPEDLTPAQTTNPPPSTTANKDAPPPKKPSLIDQINKSFDEDEKTKKMDEGKGKEPAKGTEPAKNSEPAKETEPAQTTEPAKKTVPAKGKK